MKAKTESQYRNAWNNHIAELTSLLVESTIPVSEWDIILLPLRNAVDTAANKLRDEGHWETPSTDSETPSTDIDCGACTVAIGAHTEDDGCNKPSTVYDTFDGKYHSVERQHLYDIGGDITDGATDDEK